MERWLAERLAFALETYLKNSDSLIFTQRLFYWQFSIHRNDSVASHNTLLLWVRNLRETASAAKTKPTERQPALRISENVKRLRQTFVGRLRRSESRSVLALRTSGHTVRWILHQDLKSRPYKLIMVQAFNVKTMKTEKICENLSKTQYNDIITIL